MAVLVAVGFSLRSPLTFSDSGIAKLLCAWFVALPETDPPSGFAGLLCNDSLGDVKDSSQQNQQVHGQKGA